MDSKSLLLSAALAGVLAAGAAQAHDPVTPKGKVKCYGVSKAGQNTCASADGSHSCAGQSSKDYDVNEWEYLPSADACTDKGGGQTPDEAKATPGPA